jgi:hypothetical protein
VALPAGDASPEEVNSSPTANKIKDAIGPALVDKLGSDVVVTALGMKGMRAGSLVVDYKVEVPADVTTDSLTKQSTTKHVQDSVVWPVLPAANGGADVDPGTPVVDLLQNYAYSRTAGCLAATDCSTACGYEGEEAGDIYQCLEDGSAVSTATCEGAGIGPVPTSTSMCCPPADKETCTPSDGMITDPCPEGWETDTSLSATEKAACVAEERWTLAVGVMVVIVIGAVLIGLCVHKLCCCVLCKRRCGGGNEEASGNEDERRKQLEDRYRLGKVRDTLGDEVQP